MRTSDYEFPWEWTNDYIREKIRKNEVLKKRRDRIQKSRLRHLKL